jgi:hypothetical protein
VENKGKLILNQLQTNSRVTQTASVKELNYAKRQIHDKVWS